MTSLHAFIMPPSDLSSSLKREMFGLFQECYEDVETAQFDDDLSAKDHIILLKDRDDHIQGFTTLEVLDFEIEGGRSRAIYSGDTIVHPNHWGNLSLSRAFIGLVNGIRERSPETPLFWFLIVKGHRTYRYLPTYFRDYYPQYGKPTPSHLRQIIDHLSFEKFGAQYDHGKGVIQHTQPKDRLKPHYSSVPRKDIDRKEVQYFLKRNPGYVDGDELACIAEICPGNLHAHVNRAIQMSAAA